ncbi:MAG: hypothetical protein R3199_02995 [Gemmatimonadota bacterium]|nr:hypothetical protein [Gemmatimonadota bacterium]
MSGPVGEGMVWAGVLLIAVPLAIGIGVAVALLRRGDRPDERGGTEARR